MSEMVMFVLAGLIEHGPYPDQICLFLWRRSKSFERLTASFPRMSRIKSRNRTLNNGEIRRLKNEH